MQLLPGAKIRDYEIIRLIGSGGMGEVWLARETMLDRLVAVKLISVRLTQDQAFAARFQNEARIQARLSHPHIVGLLSFFEERGDYCMVQEYAPGITLRELIERTGPIPERRALGIFRQLVEALAYAHNKGVIHRDVKPANIMVDTQNSDAVKVMDFGIARLLEDGHLTRPGSVVGSTSYMSPEQVLSQENLDQRTDIYSAGVVLYEMLSGRLPFDPNSESHYSIQNKIVSQELPDPRSVYPYISDATVFLLRRLTQKNRDFRLARIANALNLADHGSQGVMGSAPGKDFPSAADEDLVLEDPPKRAKTWLDFWYIYLLLIGLIAFLLYRYATSPVQTDWPVQPGSVAGTDTAGVEVAPLAAKTVEKYMPAGPDFIYVAGGTFHMGANGVNANEQPVHQVQVSPFYICRHEVTQAEWSSVLGHNPAYNAGPDHPVERISWEDAVNYCNNRSIREGLQPCYRGYMDDLYCDFGANGYRLPTEAEWEYAARGGARGRGFSFSGSNSLADVAWYSHNSGQKSHRVGSRDPNELGLYDMSGNVWEWCWDWYDPAYYSWGAYSDPRGPDYGTQRTLRGGSWNYDSTLNRVAFRNMDLSTTKYYNLGLRVVRSRM